MDNTKYELLERGIITKTFFSLQRLTEYLKANFASTDIAYLRVHGVTVREVGTSDERA